MSFFWRGLMKEFERKSRDYAFSLALVKYANLKTIFQEKNWKKEKIMTDIFQTSSQVFEVFDS